MRVTCLSLGNIYYLTKFGAQGVRSKTVQAFICHGCMVEIQVVSYRYPLQVFKNSSDIVLYSFIAHDLTGNVLNRVFVICLGLLRWCSTSHLNNGTTCGRFLLVPRIVFVKNMFDAVN